jgi:acyl dehydratase
VKRFASLADFAAAPGGPLGTSGWHELNQSLIDRFADVTEDRQWIHTDPASAAAGPYGATVAHGFLMLSLFPVFLSEIFIITDSDLMVNRRVDNVRFRNPVLAGESVRGTAALRSARVRPKGFYEATLAVDVSSDARPEPVCSADLTVLLSQKR